MSTDSQHEVVCNLTTSTLTSYNGTPPLRSPTIAADVAKSAFTPPTSPTGPGYPASTVPLPHPTLQQLQQAYGTYISPVSGRSLVNHLPRVR